MIPQQNTASLALEQPCRGCTRLFRREAQAHLFSASGDRRPIDGYHRHCTRTRHWGSTVSRPAKLSVLHARSAAAKASSQRSVGVHCSCQPSSHCNRYSLRGLQDGYSAAGDPQIRTLSILHSGLNPRHVILHILRWQSEATRLCCQRHLRLARSTAARTIRGSSAASTSVGQRHFSSWAHARCGRCTAAQRWPRWPTQASSLVASAICVLRVRSRRLSCSSCFAAETEILDRRALSDAHLSDRTHTLTRAARVPL